MRHIIDKLPIVLAALIACIFACPIKAVSSNMIFEWTPFEAKRDLELGFQKKELYNKLMDYPLDLSKNIEKNEAPTVPANEKKDTNWNEFNLRYFKLYFSTVVTAPQKEGWPWQYGDKVDKLEMVKSLPSMFQNVPSRTTFESLGKIFEPQIKLGISF